MSANTRWSHGILFLLLPWIVVCSQEMPGLSGEEGRPTPAGIILVSIDTLRADHLGVYGYERPTSPFIDELAAGGTVFENAVSSAPWTLPSHASMLTGVYPSSHRAVEGQQRISPSVPMAAELFQDAGWRTGGFVASYYVSDRYGFARGFDSFNDFDRTSKNNAKNKVRGAQVIDAATAWLEEEPGRPFFAFVHVYDVHFNYNPPPEHAALFDTGYKGERPRYKKYFHYFDNPVPADLMAQEIAMYDGEIHYVDSQLRRLYDTLSRLGVAEDTLIIITADHGEEFFERGSWGHAHTLYEEQLNVPLILHGPGVKSGHRSSVPVRHVDLLPSLLEAVGLDPPGGVHGRSLMGLAAGEEDVGPRPAFMETSRFDTNKIGLRRGDEKLIFNLNSSEVELYDLAADPGESRNLSAERPERVAALKDELLHSAASFVPDRWSVRWFARGGDEVSGQIGSKRGYFLATRVAPGGGELRPSVDGDLSFLLKPGGILEVAVLPVDAHVEVSDARVGTEPVRIAYGDQGRFQPAGRLTTADLKRDELLSVPVPESPALAFWLKQSAAGGGTFHMTEADKDKLRSLGYVVE